MEADDTLEEFWVAVGHESKPAPVVVVSAFPDSQTPEKGSAYRLTQALIERVHENKGTTVFWLGLLSVHDTELLTVRQGVDIAEGARSRTLEFAADFTMEQYAVVGFFGIWSDSVGGFPLVVAPFMGGSVSVSPGTLVQAVCKLTL